MRCIVWRWKRTSSTRKRSSFTFYEPRVWAREDLLPPILLAHIACNDDTLFYRGKVNLGGGEWVSEKYLPLNYAIEKPPLFFVCILPSNKDFRSLLSRVSRFLTSSLLWINFLRDKITLLFFARPWSLKKFGEPIAYNFAARGDGTTI